MEGVIFENADVIITQIQRVQLVEVVKQSTVIDAKLVVTQISWKENKKVRHTLYKTHYQVWKTLI